MLGFSRLASVFGWQPNAAAPVAVSPGPYEPGQYLRVAVADPRADAPFPRDAVVRFERRLAPTNRQFFPSLRVERHGRRSAYLAEHLEPIPADVLAAWNGDIPETWTPPPPAPTPAPDPVPGGGHDLATTDPSASTALDCPFTVGQLLIFEDNQPELRDADGDRGDTGFLSGAVVRFDRLDSYGWAEVSRSYACDAIDPDFLQSVPPGLVRLWGADVPTLIGDHLAAFERSIAPVDSPDPDPAGFRLTQWVTAREFRHGDAVLWQEGEVLRFGGRNADGAAIVGRDGVWGAIPAGYLTAVAPEVLAAWGDEVPLVLPRAADPGAMEREPLIVGSRRADGSPVAVQHGIQVPTGPPAGFADSGPFLRTESSLEAEAAIKAALARDAAGLGPVQVLRTGAAVVFTEGGIALTSEPADPIPAVDEVRLRYPDRAEDLGRAILHEHAFEAIEFALGRVPEHPKRHITQDDIPATVDRIVAGIKRGELAIATLESIASRLGVAGPAGDKASPLDRNHSDDVAAAFNRVMAAIDQLRDLEPDPDAAAARAALTTLHTVAAAYDLPVESPAKFEEAICLALDCDRQLNATLLRLSALVGASVSVVYGDDPEPANRIAITEARLTWALHEWDAMRRVRPGDQPILVDQLASAAIASATAALAALEGPNPRTAPSDVVGLLRTPGGLELFRDRVEVLVDRLRRPDRETMVALRAVVERLGVPEPLRRGDGSIARAAQDACRRLDALIARAGAEEEAFADEEPEPPPLIRNLHPGQWVEVIAGYRTGAEPIFSVGTIVQVERYLAADLIRIERDGSSDEVEVRMVRAVPPDLLAAWGDDVPRMMPANPTEPEPAVPVIVPEPAPTPEPEPESAWFEVVTSEQHLSDRFPVGSVVRSSPGGDDDLRRISRGDVVDVVWADQIRPVLDEVVAGWGDEVPLRMAKSYPAFRYDRIGMTAEELASREPGVWPLSSFYWFCPAIHGSPCREPHHLPMAVFDRLPELPKYRGSVALYRSRVAAFDALRTALLALSAPDPITP